MKPIFLYLASIVFIVLTSPVGFGQRTFSSLDSLINYSASKSTTLKSGDLKLSQAEKAKLAAIAGIIDLSGGVSINSTNNTRLPVSLFPAETFGGEPGTYQEIQTGIPFTNNFSQNAELKLVNISGWKNLKLSKINIDATITDNKLAQKNLFENIAASYYNILTLQEQLQSIKKNSMASDTLYQLVKNKFDVGLAKQQDLNDAQVNQINTLESVNQLVYLIEQQYIALKILCDIPETENIVIKEAVAYSDNNQLPAINFNDLSLRSSELKEASASTYYSQLKLNYLPYLSAFASNSYQQFSDQFSLFDSDVRWIQSNYVGLKAVWYIPSATSISQVSKSKYDYLLSQQNTEHSRIKSQLDFKQLSVDFEKSLSQMIASKQISELRTDSYTKNLANYQQGILSLDVLLNSYNAMVTSQYNYIAAAVSVMHSRSKITINNQQQ